MPGAGAAGDPAAALAGVQFSYEEERACLLTVGDAALLRRMLLNLIANALGAAGSGGQAGLRLADARSAAVLTVWDNGPGLPPCAEERGAESLLRRPDGLGLGLSIARRVASLHGGALVLEQREGRGLRSVVSLPVCPPERNQMLKTPQMGCDPTGGFSPGIGGTVRCAALPGLFAGGRGIGAHTSVCWRSPAAFCTGGAKRRSPLSRRGAPDGRGGERSASGFDGLRHARDVWSRACFSLPVPEMAGAGLDAGRRTWDNKG